MRVAALVMVVMLAGCQLADDPEPPKCPAGSHVEVERCVADQTSDLRVKIGPASGGMLCAGDAGLQRPPSIVPETLTVKSGASFQFQNDDSVPHEVRGVDGTLWVTAPAGRLSPLVSIAKVGTWGYRVSDCEKGGFITVE